MAVCCGGSCCSSSLYWSLAVCGYVIDLKSWSLPFFDSSKYGRLSRDLGLLDLTSLEAVDLVSLLLVSSGVMIGLDNTSWLGERFPLPLALRGPWSIGLSDFGISTRGWTIKGEACLLRESKLASSSLLVLDSSLSTTASISKLPYAVSTTGN